MITFNELTIRNFLSYGNNTTTLKLDFNQPTLIVGRNYDSSVDGQIDSNGSGKSAILNAIVYCLYDRTISNIEKSEMINYINGKNMEVSITFTTESGFYKIERYRKNKVKGGDGVRLFYNSSAAKFDDDTDKTPDSVSNTNKEIERILGIPFDMFARIVVFSASYEPFLSLPSSHASKANQRDIIEELFGLTELTRKADILKSLIIETKQLLKDTSTKNEHILAERARYEGQIASTNEKLRQWDISLTSQQELINKSLNSLINIDVDAIRNILSDLDSLKSRKAELASEINLVSTNLNNAVKNNAQIESFRVAEQNQIARLCAELAALTVIDTKQLNGIVEKLDNCKSEISSETIKMKKNEHDLGVLNQRKIKLSDEIEHLTDNTCPYCNQPYHESQEKLEVCKDEMVSLGVQIGELNLINTEIKRNITTLNEEITPLLNIPIPNNLKTIENDILVRTTELEVARNSQTPFVLMDTTQLETDLVKLKDQTSEINGLIQDRDCNLGEYVAPSVDNKEWTIESVNQISSQMAILTEKLESLMSQTNPFIEVRTELQEILDTKIEHVNIVAVDELYSDLEHQEFLLKLLTKKDSFVRKALLNRNIPFLNGRLSYYLNSIGLSHNVTFTEEMTAKITHFGTEYNFDNLSSGQKARVNLALLFAFRDVLQARFSRIGFCILDECLDVGLGNVGVQLAAKMIKSVASHDKLSMFVISHRDEITSIFDERVEIELRNGFSTINTNTTT